jgi:hypothetical protein
MAEMAKGPRYAYLVEELTNAIAVCMFEESHPAMHQALQFVLDTLAFESLLDDEAQDARQRIEGLLSFTEEDVREARRRRAAGVEGYTPLGAHLDRLTEEERRSLARSLVELLVFCVSQEPQSLVRRSGSIPA